MTAVPPPTAKPLHRKRVSCARIVPKCSTMPIDDSGLWFKIWSAKTLKCQNFFELGPHIFKTTKVSKPCYSELDDSSIKGLRDRFVDTITTQSYNWGLVQDFIDPMFFVFVHGKPGLDLPMFEQIRFFPEPHDTKESTAKLHGEERQFVQNTVALYETTRTHGVSTGQIIFKINDCVPYLKTFCNMIVTNDDSLPSSTKLLLWACAVYILDLKTEYDVFMEVSEQSPDDNPDSFSNESITEPPEGYKKIFIEFVTDEGYVLLNGRKDGAVQKIYSGVSTVRGTQTIETFADLTFTVICVRYKINIEPSALKNRGITKKLSQGKKVRFDHGKLVTDITEAVKGVFKEEIDPMKKQLTELIGLIKSAKPNNPPSIQTPQLQKIDAASSRKEKLLAARKLVGQLEEEENIEEAKRISQIRQLQMKRQKVIDERKKIEEKFAAEKLALELKLQETAKQKDTEDEKLAEQIRALELSVEK